VRSAAPLYVDTLESRVSRAWREDDRLQARRIVLGTSHRPLNACQRSPVFVVEPPCKRGRREHGRLVRKSLRIEALRIERPDDGPAIGEYAGDSDDRWLCVR